MVIFNELFQTVRLSKWYLHFDTPSFPFYADAGESAMLLLPCPTTAQPVTLRASPI